MTVVALVLFWVGTALALLALVGFGCVRVLENLGMDSPAKDEDCVEILLLGVALLAGAAMWGLA